MDRFLFATHRLDQATLFACPPAPVGSFSMALDSEEGLLLQFRAETPSNMALRPVNGAVYTVSTDSFEQVKDFPREWVSTLPMPPLDFEPVTGWQQPMERGVQIFCLAAMDRAIFDPKHTSYLFSGRIDRTRLAKFVSSIPAPLVWLNEATNVNPDAELQALIALL
jgi:hypothetical protein